jgi:hypothetical protein
MTTVITHAMLVSRASKPQRDRETQRQTARKETEREGESHIEGDRVSERLRRHRERRDMA